MKNKKRSVKSQGATVDYKSPRGRHRHQCTCGYIWEHKNSCRGNTHSHTCKCGREVWDWYIGPEPPTEKPKVQSKLEQLKDYLQAKFL